MDFTRQLSIFDPGNYRYESVAIVGQGSVGSFVSLVLSKMGITNLIIYDSDKIEKHNLPNQFFMKSHLKKKKTAAVKELLKGFTDAKVTIRNNVEKDTFISSKIVITTTDSMSSRKLVYEMIKGKADLLIDARMGGEVFVVYTVNLKNQKARKEYEKTLHSDEVANQQRCTERTIIYNVMGIASIIANQLKKYLTKEKYHKQIAFDYKNVEMFKK